jgi:L-threonylcarbamoyladenylate synthase
MTQVMAKVIRLSAGLPLEQIEDLVGVTRRDGVIAVPTETFYALAASAHSRPALERVLTIKGRPAGKPLLVLIGERSQLNHLIQNIPRAAAVLMDRFWPGPLTLVFNAAESLPAALTAGTGTIGIRLPAHDFLRTVLRRTGPLTGTSANRSGEVPPVTAEQVVASLGEVIDAILDGGPTPGGPASTVLDVTGPVRLIREGPISEDQIRAALRAAGADPSHG